MSNFYLFIVLATNLFKIEPTYICIVSDRSLSKTIRSDLEYKRQSNYTNFTDYNLLKLTKDNIFVLLQI